MADELFEVRDGELSDDEPFYINPKDERSSYPFTDGELMEDADESEAAKIRAGLRRVLDAMSNAIGGDM